MIILIFFSRLPMDNASRQQAIPRQGVEKKLHIDG
jgi:hypothetical protein